MKVKPYIEVDGWYTRCPNCLVEVLPLMDCQNCLQELDWDWLNIMHSEDYKINEKE